MGNSGHDLVIDILAVIWYHISVKQIKETMSMIYTSRFSNPELKKGFYTAVRISLGAPKWDTGYRLYGEIKDLMPFGLLGKYDNSPEAFRRKYFARLDGIGVNRIQRQLAHFDKMGQDVVLLCWEDVRKDGEWCHRTMFSEWWMGKTGEKIQECTGSTIGIGEQANGASGRT